VLWPPGVYKPLRNKWSWHKISNIVWVDQPVGSGFSQGTVTAKDQHDVARQFMGFWKNFVDAFSIHGFKIYITGSSYSGMFSPYLASAMLDTNNTAYFDVNGMMIWDGLYSKESLTMDIPVASFVDSWSRLFAFNDSFTEYIHSRAQECGYTDYLKKYLQFPPTGVQPAVLPGHQANDLPLSKCSLWNLVWNGATEINPCFSVYEILHSCPLPYDPLGFTDWFRYRPKDAGPLYFDRSDVKAAINAPSTARWVFCNPYVSGFINNTDQSVNAGPGSQPVIPNVIDRTQNVIIGHGAQDFRYLAEGTLLAIQNMTWGGQLGFQTRPSEPLFVPYHSADYETNEGLEALGGGGGTLGTVHRERGLTYLGVNTAGHMMTADEPALAFRAVEVLLGRVDGFQSHARFTN
jgi:carboxypeptidase D